MLETLLLLPLLGGPPASPAVQEAAAQESAQSAQDRLDELTDEMDEIIAQWRKEAAEARKAAEEGDTTKAMPMRPDLTALMAKFQSAASDYAGTDDAVPFLLWILQNDGGGDGSKDALATLTKSHASSERLAELGRMFPYLAQFCGEEEAKAFFTAVREQNKNVDIVGWVALADLGETVKTADRESDEYKGARAKLLELAAKVEDKQLAAQLQSESTCAKNSARARWLRTSKASTSTAPSSSCPTTAAKSSSSTSGEIGEAPAGPCTRTSGRSWKK